MISNQVRYPNQNTRERQRKTPASNVPCPACSFSNCEIHKMLATIHPPNGDPNKCCFRGPSFNSDKDMREKLHQYNLKHPGDKGQKIIYTR